MNRAQQLGYMLFGNNISPISKDDFFIESEQMSIEDIKCMELPLEAGWLERFVHTDGILYGCIRLVKNGEFYFVKDIGAGN
jgi:hypothetical protein